MDAERVRTSAFAMPLINPSYPPGHYRLSPASTSSSPTAPIRRRSGGSCRSRSRWPDRSCITSGARGGAAWRRPRALAPAVDVQLVHHQERQLASHAQPGSMPDDAG